jgi:hypothetical protein
MKVQVNLKVKANCGENTSFELVVNPEDTVTTVKERIAALQLIPFPEQDLVFDGEVLSVEKRLSECGVKEGKSLDFEVKAPEEYLVRQLTELLQARDLSPDELGLLYCYKHAVSINQALKLIGHDGKFVDFLKQQKVLSIENTRVALKREETALKPFSLVDEVVQLLKSEAGTLDIKDLKTKFVQKFNVSLAGIAGVKPMEFLAQHKDLFVVNGRLVSLKGVGEVEASTPSAPPPQVQEKPVVAPPGLEDFPSEPAQPIDCQQYLDLHNKICGRSHNSKTAQALNDIVEKVSEVVFLNVEHVVKGGSVGKGTAISGASDAEVVFFLNGLPVTGHDKWLPPLLKAVAGVLSMTIGGEPGIDDLCTTDDSIRVRVKNLITVDLRFSPIFQSYANTVQTLGQQGPEARKFYATSLVKERTQFIAKQPGHVKVTIRLMKWWRDQQTWTDKVHRPNDEIIELVSV